MEYTCALDVLDDNPEGVGPNRLARWLGMAKQSADYLTNEAKGAMRNGGVAQGDASGDSKTKPGPQHGTAKDGS
jgi:hypothetical protein